MADGSTLISRQSSDLRFNAIENFDIFQVRQYLLGKIQLTDIQKLNDALDDLKERLTEGGSHKIELPEISAEYEVNEKLLIRKFLERYRVEPSEFVPSISLKSLERRRARKAAIYGHKVDCQMKFFVRDVDLSLEELRIKWIDWVPEPYVGTIFETAGTEYALQGFRDFGLERGPKEHEYIQKYRLSVHISGGMDPREQEEYWQPYAGPKFLGKSAAIAWLEQNTLVAAEMPIN